MSPDTINIWMGRFDSKEHFTSYFIETYSEDDDDAPISPFAASQNQTFYDHDWLEVHYTDKEQSDLIGNIPDKFHHGVNAILNEKNITNANAIILFYDEWDSPVAKVENPELWYLGLFDDDFLKKNRAQYTAESIPSEFWTNFPKGSDEISALETQAQSDIASMIKLGIMASCGINMEKDAGRKRTLFKQANASPVMIKEALLAVANSNNADAWYMLYQESISEAKHLASDDDRREYIETAVKLGSDDAKSTLASMLMSGWLSKLYEEDYDRAEELLLSLSDFNDSGTLHQLYCLYSNKDDDENAFLWKLREADNFGDSSSTNTIAEMYIEGTGTEKNLVQAAKYLYLYLCQSENDGFNEYDLELLEQLSNDELQSGRALAKEWIEQKGVAIAAARGQLAHFSGEEFDPFEKYLNK